MMATSTDPTAADGARSRVSRIRQEVDAILTDSMLQDDEELEELNPPQGAVAAATSESIQRLEAQIAEAEKTLQQQKQLVQRMSQESRSTPRRQRASATFVSRGGSTQNYPEAYAGDRVAEGSTPADWRSPLARSTPHLPQQGEAGESWQALAPRTSAYESNTRREKYPRKPDLPLPTYKTGNNWYEFLKEFENVAQMVRLTHDQMLPYLKNSLPDEGRQLLIRKDIEQYAAALVILDDMYCPRRNAMTVFDELNKITQKPGERLHNLASRLESAAKQHISRLSSHMTREEVDNLVCTRFRQSLLDEDTRHHLLWDQQRQTMNLDQMVAVAQSFEDEREQTATKTKRGLRTTDDEGSSEMKKMQAQIAELQKAVAEVLAGQKGSSAEQHPRSRQSQRHSRQQRESQQDRSPRKKYTCWNCGEMGHMKRDCKSELVGDGFTHQKRFWQQRRQKRESLNE